MKPLLVLLALLTLTGCRVWFDAACTVDDDCGDRSCVEGFCATAPLCNRDHECDVGEVCSAPLGGTCGARPPGDLLRVSVNGRDACATYEEDGKEQLFCWGAFETEVARSSPREVNLGSGALFLAAGELASST